MGLKIAATSFPWPPHTSFSHQTVPKRRGFAGPVFSRKSMLFGGHQCSNLHTSPRSRVGVFAMALSASSDSFPGEDISKRMQDWEWFQKMQEDLDFPERYVIIPANIERKANSIDIPLSLRMIKRKKQWQEGVMVAGESAYCSVKRAFSSMVFIIRELQSCTLQMREVLFFEDLRGIVASVQKEMHASFVWLFEKVFSHTPTLMMHVMILLANYSVYSMSMNAAIAATPVVLMEEVSVVEDSSAAKQKFDSSIVRKLNLSSLNGNTHSVGGNGGGGNHRPVANGTDGDGKFDGSNYHQSNATSLPTSIYRRDECTEEEAVLWNSIVEEASRLEAMLRGISLDHETMQRFVSPADVKIEGDQYSEHFVTELQYQTELAQDPNNPLLLANYAQFLYLVSRDYDRAEWYFKRAMEAEPKDAEALNKYANFLWLAKNDLWGAEEAYLEAISSEPTNSYYAADYAHFLWNTGGQDTCFPLDDSQ